ncbi:MAG: hypothetical protein ACLFR0_07000, partial [Alphaproteobacteria bacterium]
KVKDQACFIYLITGRSMQAMKTHTHNPFLFDISFKAVYFDAMLTRLKEFFELKTTIDHFNGHFFDEHGQCIASVMIDIDPNRIKVNRTDFDKETVDYAYSLCSNGFIYNDQIPADENGKIRSLQGDDKAQALQIINDSLAMCGTSASHNSELCKIPMRYQKLLSQRQENTQGHIVQIDHTAE